MIFGYIILEAFILLNLNTSSHVRIGIPSAPFSSHFIALG